MSIKDKIIALRDVFKDDKDGLDLISDTINSFADYVKIVTELETVTIILRLNMAPAVYRERTQLLDTNRRICHNAVIAGVNILNRLSKMNNLELFFEGDVTDRYAVGSFAGQVTKEIFDKRER